MQQILIDSLIYIVRIILSGICGLMIGWERQKRIKSAGIKTHFIIAVASALMVIVSKYGFLDALTVSGTSVDVSRVAAGILAGVGLMGGGLVISGKQGFTSGITTAAGLWATIAIGMCFGAGMYIVGFATTLLLLLAQFFFHKSVKLAQGYWHGQIDFYVKKGEIDVEEVSARLEDVEINVLRMKCEFMGDKSQKLKVVFAAPMEKSRGEVVKLINSIPHVHSYEF